MKLPRDIDGQDLVRALARLGYRVKRREGSHIRLSTYERGEHHITIPDHRPLKIGTLGHILADVGRHHGLGKAELVARLFS